MAINKIKGTDLSETLTGSNSITVKDIITAGKGNDTVHGNAGNDKIDGGVGNDTLNGGAGIDQIFGKAGNDTLNGGTENDVLDGGVDNDLINGGDGNDTIIGNFGNDTMNGGNGNDYLVSSSGNDVVNGEAGNDYIVAGSGNDTIDGGSNDAVTFSGGVFTNGDWLSFSETTSINLNLTTGVGTGGAAGDVWSNIEHFEGSSSKDVITGSDTIAGYIAGGGGNDVITAGAVAGDVIRGDAGDDRLIGVSGADFFVIQKNLGLDRIVNFETGGIDKLLVSISTFGLTGTAGSAIDSAVLQSGTSDVAASSTIRFFFETDTQILWADRDGSGTLHDPVAVAILDGMIDVSVSDFMLTA